MVRERWSMVLALLSACSDSDPPSARQSAHLLPGRYHRERCGLKENWCPFDSKECKVPETFTLRAGHPDPNTTVWNVEEVDGDFPADAIQNKVGTHITIDFEQVPDSGSASHDCEGVATITCALSADVFDNGTLVGFCREELQGTCDCDPEDPCEGGASGTPFSCDATHEVVFVLDEP